MVTGTMVRVVSGLVDWGERREQLEGMYAPPTPMYLHAGLGVGVEGGLEAQLGDADGLEKGPDHADEVLQREVVVRHQPLHLDTRAGAQARQQERKKRSDGDGDDDASLVELVNNERR